MRFPSRLMLWGLLVTAVAMAQTPAAAASAIRRLLDQQTAAWNRGDIPAFMNGYWQSPRTEFIGSSGITRGWATVRDRYLKNYPDAATRGQLTFSHLEVTVLSPDAAYVVGEFHLARVRDQPHGVFTLLFRHFPEGWRIVSDHSTGTP